uniref:DUF7745 domain-containing protein n=1 Tax=Nicotiana tabacum TaxID=4097 RepID=A0A1S3Z360_TOBAC
MSTVQNTPFTVVDEAPLQLQMWWYDLGENGQKWVTKYLGALTDIMKIKPWDDLIEALVTFWDPVHNVFRFSDFELTPTLEEIAGYSGFGRDLRNQELIFPRALSVHRFFDLLNISKQIRKTNVVEGCCSFYFLYSRFGKPNGFEMHEKGLNNKQNKDTWQIHHRFAFIVAFLEILVFPNEERTIDTRIARVVQVLTTKEHHTLAPIILSDIYRALTLCKSGAKSNNDPQLDAHDAQHYSPELTLNVPDSYKHTPHNVFPIEIEKPKKNMEQEEMTRKMKSLEQTMRNIQGLGGHKSVSFNDLCMFPHVHLPPGFKTPKFDKYDGHGDPVPHLKRGAGGKEELLMAYFGESLTGISSEWFIDQDISLWHIWNDMAQDFAARVKLPMKEAEMINYFLQAQDPDYLHYMLAAIGKPFAEAIEIGEIVENGMKSGKIVSQ